MDLSDFFKGDGKLPAKVRKEAHGKTASFLPGRDEVGDDIHWGRTGAIDHVLQGRSIGGAENSALQALTDRGRAAHALELPVSAGTRVSFVHNLGSVLHYAFVPDEGVQGTVVTVRGAAGDVTVHDGMVMVAWDDGNFLPTHPEHLRLAKKGKQARTVRMSFSSLGDLAGLFEQAKTGSSDLVHKATKDLWSFRKEGEEYVIERLFDADGGPLKG